MAASAPILATKLYIPPPRPKVVIRSRLIERLNEGLAAVRTPGVTLISTPAGFGKTTLVSEWVNNLQWRNTPTFLNDFIVEEDREMYARNYHHHVAGLRHAVTFRFRGLRKDGSTFAAETDMIPLCWRGHPVAYHFVREISWRAASGLKLGMNFVRR